MTGTRKRTGRAVENFPDPAVLDSLAGVRVIVVGDVMVDRYLMGSVRRISPEAPVPVVDIEEESLRLGGAANVAHNIRSLGGIPVLCGVIGTDREGRWLKGEMEKRGMKTVGLVEEAGIPTTVKTRIMAHHQQVVRFDREKRDAAGRGTASAVAAKVRSEWKTAGGVVVSDYAKGVISEKLLDRIRSLNRGKKILPVTVDPKAPSFAIYRKATVLTPNRGEAMAAAFSGIQRGTVDEAGRKILRQSGAGAVLITRGEDGMSLYERRRKPLHIPTNARDVYDVTGAGDTVIATLSLGLSSGLSLPDAARLANVAAGCVVAEMGTVPVDRNRLRDVLARHAGAGRERP